MHRVSLERVPASSLQRHDRTATKSNSITFVIMLIIIRKLHEPDDAEPPAVAAVGGCVYKSIYFVVKGTTS